MKRLGIPKSSIKKGSFTYFFLLFFLLLCSPALLFGSAYYNKLSKQIDNEVTQRQQEVIQSIKADVDMRILDLDTLSVKLGNSVWVREITYMQNKKIDKKRIDANEITNYVEQLRTHEVLNSFTVCISVLFLDKDYVISSHGVSTGNIFYNELFECEDFTYQDIIKFSESGHDSKIYYTSKLSINTIQRNGQKMGNSLIYICPLNQNAFNKAIMIAYMPVSNIEKVVKRRLEPVSYPITIYDENGQELLHISRGQEQSEPINEITSTSSVNGWQYKISIPMSAYKDAKTNLRVGAYVISCLTFILMVTIVYCLSNCQIAPLQEMCRSLGCRSSGYYSDEWYKRQKINYYQLENLISLTIENEDLLKQQNEKLKPVVRNAILLKILYGVSEDNEMQSMINGGHPLFRYHRYTICLLVSEKCIDLDELKRDIGGSVESVTSYCLKVEDMITAIILNHEENADIFGWLEEMNQIISKRHPDSNGTLFVGNTCNDIGKIHNSYKEARRLLEYRVEDYGKNSTIFYYSELINSNNIIYYPIQIEIRLINVLKEGNIKATENILSDIINKNKDNVGLSLRNTRFLAYSLITTAARAIGSLNQRYDSFIDCLNHIETLDEVKEILAYVKKKYRDVVGIFYNQKKEMDSDMIYKINQFMEENYCMPDISLSMLAGYVGKPEYFVSRFFKKIYGENFLECLHRMRMEKAKKLFDSGLLVHEVAERTGYISDITFRRVFKKYEGITPSEYKSVLQE